MEAKHRFFAIDLPKFFSEMWRKRCQKLEECYCRFTIYFTCLVTMVGKDHHLRNGRIEFHITDIVTHLSNRLMKNFQRLFRLFAFCNICHLTKERNNPAQKIENTFYTVFSPRFCGVEWSD